MPVKLVPCCASVDATMKLSSSDGKKPLGTMTASQAVAPISKKEASNVLRRCLRMKSSERE